MTTQAIVETAAPESVLIIQPPLQPLLQPLLPMTLVQRAFEAGNLELVERAMALQERWEAQQARKAFDEAMAKAQAELPVLTKNRKVNLGNGRGYAYEDFAEIDRTVKPVLNKHGVYYRHQTLDLDDGRIRVTCILTGHGHREENSMSAKPDTSGSKNDAQSRGSIQTYLQRYTLKAACGLAASEDTDARSPAPQQQETGELISKEQIELIENALKVREMPKDRFLNWVRLASHGKYEIKDVGDLPVSIFETCLAKIRQAGEPQ